MSDPYPPPPSFEKPESGQTPGSSDPTPPAYQQPGQASAYPPPGQPQGYQQPGQPAYGGQGGPQALSPSDERMWAMLGHLGGILFGFLAPLVVWLVQREKSGLVNDQGKEALNFQITLTIGYVVSSVLSIVGIGLLLFPIVWIAGIVFAIIGGMAANRGELYRYPFTLRLIS